MSTAGKKRCKGYCKWHEGLPPPWLCDGSMFCFVFLGGLFCFIGRGGLKHAQLSLKRSKKDIFNQFTLFWNPQTVLYIFCFSHFLWCWNKLMHFYCLLNKITSLCCIIKVSCFFVRPAWSPFFIPTVKKKKRANSSVRYHLSFSQEPPNKSFLCREIDPLTLLLSLWSFWVSFLPGVKSWEWQEKYLQEETEGKQSVWRGLKVIQRLVR